VTKRGEEVHLTPTEYRLLSLLAKNADKIMLHEDLLTHVWGTEYRSELEYLRAYVRHLRRKIEDDPGQPRYIISKPGVGYTLVRPCGNGSE
jgi:two-component system KDP operon response regulator KdpE